MEDKEEQHTEEQPAAAVDSEESESEEEKDDEENEEPEEPMTKAQAKQKYKAANAHLDAPNTAAGLFVRRFGYVLLKRLCLC